MPGSGAATAFPSAGVRPGRLRRGCPALPLLARAARVGGYARGPCRGAPGRHVIRHMPDPQCGRVPAVQQGGAFAAVPYGHHAGVGTQPADPRCLACGLGAPRVRPAGDDRPPYRPPLLRSSPNTLAHRRAQPVIGVAGRRIQGRQACSVARALQSSVAVVGDVDLISEERSLRDRVPRSLPGPGNHRPRSSAGTPQCERSPGTVNSSLRMGRAGSVETGAEVVAVWPHDDR